MRLEHPRSLDYQLVRFNLTILSIFILVGSLVTIGCDSNPRSPTSSNNPDTTGQGGNNGGGNLAVYGTMFFQSSISTRWLVELPATVVNGVLLGENESSDTLTASITYNGRISFGQKKNLTFLWRGGVSGNTVIQFYVSSDGIHWQNAPYHPDSDWQAAPHVLFTEDGIPLTFKFTFKIPPGGRVRLTEVRAYGK